MPSIDFLKFINPAPDLTVRNVNGRPVALS